ncbi:MAG: hypothetical protein WCV58_00035 [Patescibacteria group bacterium]
MKTIDRETGTPTNRVEEKELPITVADDFDKVVANAEKVADVIDRHLNFESKLQGSDLNPVSLCREQRVALTTDLDSATQRG